MRTVTDQLNRSIQVPDIPQRIISLCPSLTETLFELGLGPQLIGRTRFCKHPAGQAGSVQAVGGTKNVDEQAIERLAPDLIIAEKEENTPEMVESLSRKYPVYVTDVKTIDEAVGMILDLGNLTGRMQEADQLAHRIRGEFALLSHPKGIRAAYLIWQKPYMTVGRDTYIHSILEKSGFINVFAEKHERYPAITLEELELLQPDCVLLSSEPYHFTEVHQNQFQQLLPGSIPYLVDGELFSWYGSRMLQAPDYLNSLVERIQQDLKRKKDMANRILSKVNPV